MVLTISIPIVIFIVSGVFLWINSSKKQTVQVYFVGRDFPPGDTVHIDTFNTINYLALRHYLSEISGSGNVVFDLSRKYIGKNPDSALRVYKEIAAAHNNNKPYLVVDNTWGSDIAPSANFIRKNKIPFININGDHGGFFKNTASVFIGDDDDTPFRMCLFIKNILKKDSINFIAESNFSTTRAYLQMFKEVGLYIKDTLFVPSDTVQKKYVDAIAFRSTWQSNDVPLLVNTHGFYGQEILNIAKDKKSFLKILMPVYSIPLTYLQSMKNYNCDIIMLNKTWDVHADYVLKDLEYFSNTADSSLFVKSKSLTFLLRCRRAAEIIERAVSSKESQDAINKSFIIKQLDSLSYYPIRKFDDVFTYDVRDSTCTLNKDYSFKVYKDGVEFFYPKQLNENNHIIPNITFGMDIESVHAINVQAGSFTVDFFYWLKVDSIFQRSKNYISFKNIAITSDVEVLSKKIRGTPIIYTLHKVSGTCSQKLDPFYYPKDSHRLELTPEVLESQNTTQISYDGSSLKLSDEKIKQINSEGWDIHTVSYTVNNKVQPNKLGLGAGDMERFKSVTIYMNIERRAAYEILLFVTPYFLLAAIGILLMLIKNRSFDTVGDTSIGLVVGTVAYSISIAGFTPSKGNLLLIDYISSSTLFIVLLNMGLCVMQSLVFFKNNRKPVLTEKIGRWLIKLYIACSFLIVILYIMQPRWQ